VKVDHPLWLRAEVSAPLGLDVALALINEEGLPLWEIDDGGPRETERIPSVWVSPPRALFQVRAPRRQYVSAVASYQIKAEKIDGEWEREPNQSMATATPWPGDLVQISGHIHPRRDVDLYRITSRGDRLQLSLSKVQRMTLKMELLDLSGKPMAASGGPDAQGAIHLDASTKAGIEYTLRVTETSGLANPLEAYQIKRENP
jgi:hypothetical protein